MPKRKTKDDVTGLARSRHSTTDFNFGNHLVVLGALLSVTLIAAVARAESDRPHVIVILCDDLGYGDLGCYGHPHIQTPHLDNLASGGIQFTSWYSAAPVCSPARVGLLTGRSPNRAGVYDWIPPAWQKSSVQREKVHLRQSEITIPSLLQSVGYATCLSGKWHCNAHFNSNQQPQPGDFGFDHWFATQNNAAPSHANPHNFVRNGVQVGPLQGYSCQLVVDETLGWIERHVQAHPHQPFYAHVCFHEPHEPVASPEGLVQQYMPVAENRKQAEYYANVANLDDATGRLLNKLDAWDLTKNTLVIFTSDNGPETLGRYSGCHRSYGTPGPLRGMKLWTTDGGVRVPGIMRWPARIQAGQVSDATISSLDLLPTLAHLAGAEVPADLALDGTIFLPALDGGPLPREIPLCWAYYNALNEHRVALCDGDWKLLARLDGGKLPKIENIFAGNVDAVWAAELTDFELYNVAEDIGETRNLATERPAVLAELRAKLEEYYEELKATSHVWR